MTAVNRHNAPVTSRSTSAGIVRVGAVALFGVAWLVRSSSSSSESGTAPMILCSPFYVVVLVVSTAIVWRGANRHQTAAHASFGAVLIVATLWLGSTYG